MGILNSRWFQHLGGGRLERIGIGAVSKINLLLLGGHKEKEVLKLIRRVRKERRCLLTANELFILHSLAKAQATRPGIMAEVGVFEGGSTRIICEVKGNTPLHLFDTFEGLPEGVDGEKSLYKREQYAAGVESVGNYLRDYPNVHLHKGLFPDSALGVEDPDFIEAQFAFAHFDVDLYQSTLACLEYFYPRMIPGGIILSHDYSILEGVRRAFSEFLKDKPEPLIELPTTQCMVVKLSD